MAVTQTLHRLGHEQVAELCEILLAGNRENAIDFAVVFFHGQPSLTNEEGAFVSLKVFYRDAAEIPGGAGS